MGEVSSLASVYHKPAETFIGHGQIGADSVQRKGAESVILPCVSSSSLIGARRLSDDWFTSQKALQTVVAGQQAENLFDFDDGPAQEGQPSGLAATQILPSLTTATSLLSGTSMSPLDDLVLGETLAWTFLVAWEACHCLAGILLHPLWKVSRPPLRNHRRTYLACSDFDRHLYPCDYYRIETCILAWHCDRVRLNRPQPA